MTEDKQLPENIAETPEIDMPSAEKTGVKKKKKMPVGKRITKENAKQYQISASTAKRRRKEARAQMLNALTTQLDLGSEIVKAWKHQDDKQMALIEKALRIVGLHHDQSQEAIAQKFDIKTDANVKTDNAIHFVIEEAKAPQEAGNA